MSILERSIPVERIWLDISESQGSETPALHADEIALLADQLTELSRTLPKSMTLDQRIDTLLLNLPGDLTKLKAELVRKLGNNND
ncbi:hypothetical protein ACOTCL_25240 [Achromobacter xylosoxidans]